MYDKYFAGENLAALQILTCRIKKCADKMAEMVFKKQHINVCTLQPHIVCITAIDGWRVLHCQHLLISGRESFATFLKNEIFPRTHPRPKSSPFLYLKAYSLVSL